MFRSRKYYLKGKELGKEYINRETGHEEFMDEFFDYLSLVDTPTQWKDTMKGFVGVLLNKRRYAKVRKKDEETSELQRQKVFAEVSKYKPGDCFKSRDIADVTGLSRGSVGLILGMYKNLLNLTHFYKTCVWKKEPEKKLTKSEILKLKLRAAFSSQIAGKLQWNEGIETVGEVVERVDELKLKLSKRASEEMEAVLKKYNLL